MAFSERLAGRVRTLVAAHRLVTEKKMFGGMAFLLAGKMCVGVHGDDLIVRLAPEDTDKALSEPYAKVFDLTGRPMKGWLLVGSRGTAADASLNTWVSRAVRYAKSLPAKK